MEEYDTELSETAFEVGARVARRVRFGRRRASIVRDRVTAAVAPRAVAMCEELELLIAEECAVRGSDEKVPDFGRDADAREFEIEIESESE